MLPFLFDTEEKLIRREMLLEKIPNADIRVKTFSERLDGKKIFLCFEIAAFFYSLYFPTFRDSVRYLK